MRFAAPALLAIALLASPRAHAAASCSAKLPLKVRFYDVGQGLAALVELPDGRRILVDAGPPVAHSLVPSLQRDLAGKPLDLLWITHQHIDHIGGADNVINGVKVLTYADNGRTLGMPEVTKAHASAKARGTTVRTFGPSISSAPIPSTPLVKVTPITPGSWLTACKSDENQCSIGLRIDYCKSSILFTGDAETQEEAQLSPRGAVSLLQLGHHGSDTSTSAAFLARVKPRYAVISSGRPDTGANVVYCHPRVVTVQRVTQALGGPGKGVVAAFDGSVSCGPNLPAHWQKVPVSDRLWSTARDGDVVLTTTGDGNFARQ